MVETRSKERTQSKCKRRIKVFSQRKRVNNPERKSSIETQTIQREPISIGKTYTEGSSSEQERKVNALASGAEEGRDKLR